MKFEQNIGNKDQKLRMIGAAITAVLGIVIGGTVGNLLVFIFIVLVLTSVTRFCPAYTLLGMNTCAGDKKEGGCCGGGSCDSEKDAEDKKSGGCCGGAKATDDDKTA